MSEATAKATTPAMTLEELLSLPVSVDIVTAGRAFGCGRTKAYELVQRGEFPCRVLKLGLTYRVARADLFRVLGITSDVEPLTA